MNITPHQAKYYAHQLLCQKSGDERLSQALFEAQVDLQPHQIDAPLFVLENPLREGVLLADEVGLQKMQEAGAADKAVIFTESVRTQEYLFEFLGKNGYEGQIVLFSGSNKHPDSQQRYKAWLDKNAGSPHHTGSPAVDKRTALIDAFKNQAKIMIATESAAEGVNLQFCSLLINYDLPWNPQRIEQRIGRCHRYGQKSDVVVINFLNTRNDADRRVLELLTDKFKLFDGVFGASDEILGKISDGLDFEKRILEIYDTCRTPEAIQTAFDQLQQELESQIAETRKLAEERLLEYFDTDVHDRFKTRLQQTRERLDDFQRWFWLASRFALNNYADFNPQSYRFDLKTAPEPHLHLGACPIPRTKQSALPRACFTIQPLGGRPKSRLGRRIGRNQNKNQKRQTGT